MKIKWSKLVLEMIAWLSAEIFLTTLGLDNLADYGEFVFQDRDWIYIGETYDTLNVPV